jgi:tetratricopeptide (TPR) repeat protein
MSEIYGADKSFSDIMAQGAVHAIGTLYVDQGRLAEAKKMYNRALHGREKALGADHTSTLTTVNDLGWVYKDQGRLAEAEKMYEDMKVAEEKHETIQIRIFNFVLEYTF